jgi:hypothetical protein
MPPVPRPYGLAALYKSAPQVRSPPPCWQMGTRPGVDLRGGHFDAPHYRQGSKKLMLTILILAVGTVMVLVLVLLAVVVIGMRQEPPADELTMQAPSLFAALVRRLLGVYIRKPEPIPDERHGEPFLTARDARGGESHCGHTRWSK